jgi:hypothetical protein
MWPATAGAAAGGRRHERARVRCQEVDERENEREWGSADRVVVLTRSGWGILGRPVRAFGPVHKPNGSIFSQSIETLNPFSSSKHTFKKFVEYAQRLAWFLDQETYFKKIVCLDPC